MKKTILILSILVCGFSYSQVSESANINKIAEKEHKEIDREFKNKNSEEIQKEIAELDKFRREDYKKIIENIQKDELKVNLDSIPNDYTKEAEYESGMDGFRRLFSGSFDTSALRDFSGVLKSKLKLLIDEKGNVAKVTVSGNSEEMNLETLITFYKISSKGKWKPAEKNGIPVKSVYHIPVAMTFN